jgi:GH15 family glucan-1,4-alpha-glucosidase
VLDKGVSERGVFRQHYETDDLGASLLLLPIMGFLPPDDKRIRSTVLAIADELTKDGLVLRYRVEGTDTGFEGEEGTFTICSFWLVTALAMIGETDRARALCQKLLSFAGPLQLYAEEIDTTTGEHLGNFPQAFTHLALIEAVSLLIGSEPEGSYAITG